MKIDKVGIIGGGAWGTALAQAMRRAGREVTLWAREPEVVADINAHHANSAFLPGVALDPAIRATSSLREAAAGDVLLMVVPAQHVRDIGSQLRSSVGTGKPVVMCAKGIERATGRQMGEILAEVLPGARRAAL